MKQRQRRNTRGPIRWLPSLGAPDVQMRGFTLIELLVTMAITAILAMLAVPSFNEAIVNYRLTSYTNNFVASAQLARSEAIKRNSRAVVCKSAIGDACITTGGWEQGWIVFHDANNNAALDAGEVILSREQALPHPMRFTGNGPVASYVSYTAMGTTEYPSGAFQAGTLTVCTKSSLSVAAREIKISISGRPRTVKTMVAQCPV